MQINDIISMGSAVLVPDLEIMGGRGVGVIQTLRKVGGRSPKNIFSALRPQFGLKIRGEAEPQGPSPGSATAV